MFYVIISVFLLYLLFKLNKKYPSFKAFNRRNAGVVIFIVGAFAINDFYLFLDGNSGPKSRPSLASFLLLIAVYGIMYRPNTLRLIGVLKAYDSEPESWKFTATLISFFLLLTLLQFRISLGEVVVYTVLYWHILYCASISVEGKNTGNSYFGKKSALIVFSSIVPLIAKLSG